jgi:hypothetical protein
MVTLIVRVAWVSPSDVATADVERDRSVVYRRDCHAAGSPVGSFDYRSIETLGHLLLTNCRKHETGETDS